MDVKIQQEWKVLLKDEFEKDYFKNIVEFLHREKREGKTIYPPGSQIFNAFELTPPSKVKVVILGQDPYHGPRQAHGLSFSVPDGVTPPPSLKNIYKELKTDLGIDAPEHGCLEEWAKSGVLLLNSVLTVREGQAGSHRNKGWEILTDKIISLLNESEKPISFILWGAYARSKASLITNSRHLILEAAHPSPLSAYNGFFGSRPFSKTNAFLGSRAVDWRLD